VIDLLFGINGEEKTTLVLVTHNIEWLRRQIDPPNERRKNSGGKKISNRMIEYIIKIKRNIPAVWRDRWVWLMAWRDARKNLSKIILLVASLITGIAAVVSIGSLNYSLQDTLDQNAKELLGADLVINSNKKFEAEILRTIDTAKLVRAGDAEMASMIMFMNTRQSRLVKLTSNWRPVIHPHGKNVHSFINW